jgi:hypothetical protein
MLDPLRRHPKARQIARDQVEHAGHRRRAREPEDEDGRQVVERAEAVAHQLVREERERAARGFSARLHRGGRDQDGGHQARREQKHAHQERRRDQQRARVVNSRARRIGFAGDTPDQRHHRDPCLEPAHAQRQPRKDQHRRGEDGRPRAARIHLHSPRGEQRRVPRDLEQPTNEQRAVERQVWNADERRDADRLAEAAEEHGAENGEEHQRDEHVVAAQHAVQDRILHRVRRGVGGREGHGDDEVSRREPQQREDEQLANPPWEEPLEHRDRALPGVRALCHLRVDGKHASESHRDQHERGDRREHARREERDRRLVTEGREVVDAGQPDHPGPSVLAVCMPGPFDRHQEAAQPGAHPRRRTRRRVTRVGIRGAIVHRALAGEGSSGCLAE